MIVNSDQPSPQRPTRRRGQPTTKTRNTLAHAAAFVAAGKLRSEAARMMGIRPDDLHHLIRKHSRLWQETVKAAKAEYEATGRVVVEKLDEDGPRVEVRPLIRDAAAMMAAGATHGEIAEALNLRPNEIHHWQETYPAFWQSELDRAMRVAVIIIRRQAGTEAVSADPQGYIARALACKRWITATGRAIFPAGERDKLTLRTFYEEYYKPTRLTDTMPRTADSYELTLRQWELFTADPPLKEITSQTLAQFKMCLQESRGRSPGAKMSPNTVRRHLRHLQTVLDKAGPPGRGNRDAAGILQQVPWVKPPREELSPPRVVPIEHIEACYRAADAMRRPDLFDVRPSAWWRALLVLAWNTALRRRTLFAIEMSAIDWDAALLAIPPEQMKARRHLVIPLTAVAIEHLERIRGHEPRQRIFEWPHGASTFYRDLHRLQTAAGIPKSQHFGLHEIRKTLGTALYDVSPGAAQFVLGHAGGRVTQDHYVSRFRVMSRAMERLPQPAAFTAAISREMDSPTAAPAAQRTAGT